MGSGRSQEQVSALVAQLFQMRARMKNLATMMQGGSIPGMEGLEDAFKGGRQRQAQPRGERVEVLRLSLRNLESKLLHPKEMRGLVDLVARSDSFPDHL